MRILLDTNVVLDLLVDRAEFADRAQAIFSEVESGAHTGLLCATTITTVHYLASKSSGEAAARRQIARAAVVRNCTRQSCRAGGCHTRAHRRL